MIYLR